MNRTAALDSNALTYLLDAFAEGYLPRTDPDPIAPERLAMFQAFCYSGYQFWVSPTVRAEYLRIGNLAKRETHDRWARYHLHDVEPDVPDSILGSRVVVLQQRHSDIDDCRILAEAEAVQADIVLTSDADFVADLHAATEVLLMRPTEFLTSLNIAPNSPPCIRPAKGNPLAHETWWHL